MDIDEELKDMGFEEDLNLTEAEIEELKGIDTQKVALSYQQFFLNGFATDIARHEQKFFNDLYERLNLDKSKPYRANWRTGKVEMERKV